MIESAYLVGLPGAASVAWLLAVAIAPLMVALELRCPARPIRPDGLRWCIAFALTLFGSCLTRALTPSLALVSATLSSQAGFGLLGRLDFPPWLAAVIGLLVLDLTAYAAHVGLHKVPMLWRLHRVHHGDEQLDASTELRHHPVETLLVAAVIGTVVATVGISATAVTAMLSVQLALGLWQHANICPLPFEPALSLILVTPTMHQLHHADRADLHDSNFAAVFSLWDRMFGTFRHPPPGATELKFGLAAESWHRPQTLVALLVSPFRSRPTAAFQPLKSQPETMI